MSRDALGANADFLQVSGTRGKSESYGVDIHGVSADVHGPTCSQKTLVNKNGALGGGTEGGVILTSFCGSPDSFLHAAK